VATRYHFHFGALRNYGTDGRRARGSDSCPNISPGRSIDKIQVGNVASVPLPLASAARRIMRQRRVRERINGGEERELGMARDNRGRKTLNSAGTGWPTHGRHARHPFFRLPSGPTFGPASSAHTHSNCHLIDRAGTRQKRLDVIGIAIFFVHGRRCGRERRLQAPAQRTGLGILYL
jgi:hypothetical protein